MRRLWTRLCDWWHGRGYCWIQTRQDVPEADSAAEVLGLPDGEYKRLEFEDGSVWIVPASASEEFLGWMRGKDA